MVVDWSAECAAALLHSVNRVNLESNRHMRAHSLTWRGVGSVQKVPRFVTKRVLEVAKSGEIVATSAKLHPNQPEFSPRLGRHCEECTTMTSIRLCCVANLSLIKL